MKMLFVALLLTIAATTSAVSAQSTTARLSPKALFHLLQSSQYVEEAIVGTQGSVDANGNPLQMADFIFSGDRACIIPPRQAVKKCLGYDGTFYLANEYVSYGVSMGHHLVVIMYNGGGSGGVLDELVYDTGVDAPFGFGGHVTGQGMGKARFVNNKIIFNSAREAGASSARFDRAFLYEPNPAENDHLYPVKP